MYKIKLIKQHESFNIAHLYEHIIANKLINETAQIGLFNNFDYCISANVYDGIIVIEFKTNHKKVKELFKACLKKSNFKETEILKALNQISCEYELGFVYKLDNIVTELKTLSDKKWQKDSDLNITKEISEHGFNINKCKCLSFIKKRNVSFDKYSIKYKIIDLEYKLKPAAIYVLQLFALFQIDLLCNTEVTNDILYDTGDEWAEYQFENNCNLIGYAHFLNTNSKNMNRKYLEDIFYNNINNTKKIKLIRMVTEYIKNESKNKIKYFKPEAIFKYSGFIVGDKYFSKITKKDIELIFDKIKIEIALEK